MHSLNKLIAYLNLTPTMYHKYTPSANGMNAYALNLNGKTQKKRGHIFCHKKNISNPK